MDHMQSDLIETVIKDLLTKKPNVLDKAICLAAWRNIYEAEKITFRLGGDRKSRDAKARHENGQATFAKRFALRAGEVLGESEDTVSRYLRIAKGLPEEIRTILADLPIADNMSELLRLAGEPTDRQEKIVELMFSPEPFAATVTEAIAILDERPVTPATTAVPPRPLKEWLSPSEIAELGLIEHLNSGRAINAWIKTAKPFRDDEFVRARLGSGGGFEYHLFALLPFITNDDMKLRVGALLAERMEIKRQLDSLAAEGIGTEPVRWASVALDLSRVPTEDLTAELMRRAGLLPDDRGRP